MTEKSIPLRKELQDLFRANMTMILDVLKENKASFGKYCYVPTAKMAYWFGRITITPMDFIAMMHFADIMINEKPDGLEKETARKLYNEIWTNYLDKGLV